MNEQMRKEKKAEVNSKLAIIESLNLHAIEITQKLLVS